MNVRVGYEGVFIKEFVVSIGQLCVSFSPTSQQLKLRLTTNHYTTYTTRPTSPTKGELAAKFAAISLSQ